MLLALKRLAHYNRIDSPTGPSFVHFPMAPEQRTMHVKSQIADRAKFAQDSFYLLG